MLHVTEHHRSEPKADWAVQESPWQHTLYLTQEKAQTDVTKGERNNVWIKCQPCFVPVVWSISGPVKLLGVEPLPLVQSNSSSTTFGELTQEHNPFSKSQSPKGQMKSMDQRGQHY